VYELKKQIELKCEEQRVSELKKKKILLLRSQDWCKAEELRQFIIKIEQSNLITSKTKDWIEWAKLQLKEFDPLSEDIETFMSTCSSAMNSGIQNRQNP